MDQRPDRRLYSRRSFLKGFPLGIAGALLLGMVSRGVVGAGIKRFRKPPVFAKGSIFTHAKDPRRNS